MDQVIATLSDDTEVGPQLRALGTPVEITYKDFDIDREHPRRRRGRVEPRVGLVQARQVGCRSRASRSPRTSPTSSCRASFRSPAALALRKVKVKGSLTAGLRIVAICGPAFESLPRTRRERFPAPCSLSAHAPARSANALLGLAASSLRTRIGISSASLVGGCRCRLVVDGDRAGICSLIAPTAGVTDVGTQLVRRYSVATPAIIALVALD